MINDNEQTDIVSQYDHQTLEELEGQKAHLVHLTTRGFVKPKIVVGLLALVLISPFFLIYFFPEYGAIICFPLNFAAVVLIGIFNRRWLTEKNDELIKVETAIENLKGKS